MREIRNCKFGYLCDREWADLEKTDQKDVKYCNSCERTVHFCKTNKDVALAIEFNQCIAIRVSPYDHGTLMGMPAYHQPIGM